MTVLDSGNQGPPGPACPYHCARIRPKWRLRLQRPATPYPSLDPPLPASSDRRSSRSPPGCPVKLVARQDVRSVAARRGEGRSTAVLPQTALLPPPEPRRQQPSDGIGCSRGTCCHWNIAQCQLGKLARLWPGGNSAMRERLAQFWLGEFKCCMRRLQRCCSAKAERWRQDLRLPTGSLEHTMPLADRPRKLECCGIREHACEILDGGREEAFQKRKDKSGLEEVFLVL